MDNHRAKKSARTERSSEYWLLRRESLDTEAVSLKIVAVSFGKRRRTLKAVRKNFKSELQVDGNPPGYLGHAAIATITSAVADAEKRRLDALDDVHKAFVQEISSGQRNGFLSEDERVELDARARRLVALLDALLQDFKRECVAVCDGPPGRRDAAGRRARHGAEGDLRGRDASPRTRRRAIDDEGARLIRRRDDERGPERCRWRTRWNAGGDRRKNLFRTRSNLYSPRFAQRARWQDGQDGHESAFSQRRRGGRGESAATEAVAPAVRFAVWQLRHAPVGPATGPGSSRKMSSAAAW